ncbi:MAG TPA: O-antigen ligase family protein [Pirellulaceae bacterium]|nr:O-antigen ligase family protein [Pirellulaceae bacterium]
MSESGGNVFARDSDSAAQDTTDTGLRVRARAHLRILAVVIWLMILGTFTPLERDEAANGVATDAFARVKLVVRLVCLAVLSVSLVTIPRGDRWQTIKWFFGPMLVYIAWAFTSASWSPLKSVSVGQALSLLSLWALGASIAFRFRNDEDAAYLFKHAAGALVVFNSVLLAAFVMSGGGDERFSFAYAHPTAAGSTASIGILLLAMALLQGKWSWAKWIFLPGMLVHLGVLIAAESRTALLLLILCAGLTLLLSMRPGTWAVSFVATSLLFSSYLFLDGGLEGVNELGTDMTRYLERGQTRDELAAFSGREELWEVMWESHREAPVFGHGYFVTSRSGELDIWGRETNFTAHNMMFQALITTGYIGCLLFSWALLQPLLATFQSLSCQTLDKTLALMWLNIALWLVGWGLMDPGIVGPLAPNSVVIFVALGLVAGNTALARETWGQPETPRSRALQWEATV